MAEKERYTSPYKGMYRKKRGKLFTAKEFLELSRNAEKIEEKILQERDKQIPSGNIPVSGEGYQEFIKEILECYKEALDCANSAGDLLRKEGKYGAAEKAYTRALEFSRGYKNALEELDENVDVHYHRKNRATTTYEDIKKKMSANRDERLLKIGKYLGRKETRKKSKDLEGKITGVITIAGLSLGAFFLSSNLTGNVIGNLTQNSSNFIGIGLFLIGLIGAFMYFRKKK